MERSGRASTAALALAPTPSRQLMLPALLRSAKPRHWRRRAGLSAGVALGLCALPGPARAELIDDVATMKHAWRSAAQLKAQAPRLLERGTQLPLSFPSSLLNGQRACVSLVLLAAPNVSFALRSPLGRAVSQPPEASVAGLIQLSRCDEQRQELAGLILEMRSPRGVVEILIATSDLPLPSAAEQLSSRDPGPIPQPRSVGPAASLPSLSSRVLALRQAAAARGPAEFERVGLTTDDAGRGSRDLDAPPGCYRVDILGPQAPQGWRGGTDIDLEVRRLPDGALVGSDRSEALDAHLEYCTTSGGAVRVSYSGGLPGVPLLGLITRWRSPRGMPKHWSDSTKSQIALYLLRGRRSASLLYSAQRQREWLGVAGLSRVSLPTRAGACYSVFVAPHAGTPDTFALSADQGLMHVENNSAAAGSATHVSFCARQSGDAQLTVEAQGSSLIWRLIAYESGRIAPGGAT